jgi:hypothetical protein
MMYKKLVLFFGLFFCGWLLICQGLSTALIGILFYGTIVAPISLALSYSLRKFRVPLPAAYFHAFVGTWIVTALLFFIRKLLPNHFILFDLCTMAVSFVVFAKVFNSKPSGGSKGLRCQRLLGGFGVWDTIYCCTLLPVLFTLIRVGNEVTDGDFVKYYGLAFIDFGVLRGITSLLVSSEFLPEDFVHGVGPLSYHWLFFAVPAWHSTFLGGQYSLSGVLSVANYVVAIFFYKTLSHLIATLIREIVPKKVGAWSDVGAIIAIFGLNVRYFHEAVSSLTRWEFIAPTGRNSLLLNFPNSLNTFGYNTFALGVICLTLVSLNYWTKFGHKIYLVLAALWVSWLPIYSATLVPGIAFGIGLACLTKRVRSPWLTLATFGVFGLVMSYIFKSIGVFSSQGELPVVSFDGGRFLFLSLLSAPLLVCTALLPKKSLESNLLATSCLIGVGVILFPSLILLGNSSTPSDISMKTFSAVTTVFGAIAIAGLIRFRQTKWTDTTLGRQALIVTGFFIFLGFVNSFAYAMSSVIQRYPDYAGPVARLRQPNVTSLERDYFDALSYIRDTAAHSAIVICKPMLPIRDPALMISERRQFLPTTFMVDHVLGKYKQILQTRLQRWSDWQISEYSDEELARWFAEVGDYLVVDAEVVSSVWKERQRFEQWRVYKRAKPSKVVQRIE